LRRGYNKAIGLLQCRCQATFLDVESAVDVKDGLEIVDVVIAALVHGFDQILSVEAPCVILLMY